MPPPRATPMSPDERRRAIVQAATPVLLHRGRDLTTRDIAAAAGVAEGTIFKVFDSKDDVVAAIVEHLLDPSETCAELDALEPDDLTTAVVAAVDLLQRRIKDVTTLLMALHSHPGPSERHREQQREHHDRREQLLVDALTRLLEPWQHQLRLPAATVASLLRSTAFATAHPMLSDRALGDPADLAAVLLHGLLQPGDARPGASAATAGTERAGDPLPATSREALC